MHPLTNDLTQYSDNELSTKFNELSSKLNMAYRFGNGELVRQIQMVMADYQVELNNRQQKLLDEMMNKSGKLSGLIDVK